MEQHIHELEKKGMKKYLRQTLHINMCNIIGSVFLLPSFIVFSIDLIARILQRDLVHYNRPVYAFLSHTFFYQFPILFIWAVVFPLLAVVINLIPVITYAQKKRFQITNFTFVKQNLASIIIFSFGIFFILLIKLHDFAPCTFHGLMRLGITQLPHIISLCRNA